jgi:hypothetical protein
LTVRPKPTWHLRIVAQAVAAGWLGPGHWGIENGLHRRLDVSFGEDAARNGSADIAVISRRALGVARLDQSKGSLSAKLKRAGWNDEFVPNSNAIALGGTGVLARAIYSALSQ